MPSNEAVRTTSNNTLLMGGSHVRTHRIYLRLVNRDYRSIFGPLYSPPPLNFVISIRLDAQWKEALIFRKGLLLVCRTWTIAGIPLFFEHVVITERPQLGRIVQLVEAEDAPGRWTRTIVTNAPSCNIDTPSMGTTSPGFCTLATVAKEKPFMTPANRSGRLWYLSSESYLRLRSSLYSVSPGVIYGIIVRTGQTV